MLGDFWCIFSLLSFKVYSNVLFFKHNNFQLWKKTSCRLRKYSSLSPQRPAQTLDDLGPQLIPLLAQHTYERRVSFELLRSGRMTLFRPATFAADEGTVHFVIMELSLWNDCLVVYLGASLIVTGLCFQLIWNC